MILAANFRLDLSPLQIRAYVEGLKYLADDQVQFVCESALRDPKAEFMPPVGKLLGYLPAAAKSIGEVAAEREWDAILKHCERWGITVYPSDPKLELSAAGEHALRQCGWREGIIRTAPEDMHWKKRTFMDAWQTHTDTLGLQAPGREEARRLLSQTAKLIADGARGERQ